MMRDVMRDPKPRKYINGFRSAVRKATFATTHCSIERVLLVFFVSAFALSFVPRPCVHTLDAAVRLPAGGGGGGGGSWLQHSSDLEPTGFAGDLDILADYVVWKSNLPKGATSAEEDKVLDSIKKLALKAKKKKEKRPNEKIKKQQELEETVEKDDPDAESGVGEGLGLDKVFKSKDEEWEGGRFADGGEPQRFVLLPPSPHSAAHALSSTQSGSDSGGEGRGGRGGGEGSGEGSAVEQIDYSAPQFVLQHVAEERGEEETERERQERVMLEEDYLPPLPEPSGDIGEKERQFWAQPNSLGLVPCLRHSPAFLNSSLSTLKSGRYILAVVTGGLNQMRLQIGNAVIIARILGASLVVPVLQENNIWHDRSEFADVFDFNHFRKVLRNEIDVVTTLPPHYLRAKPEEFMPPAGATPQWVASHLKRPLHNNHVILIRGLDQSLTVNLPLELQRLKCKVEFHALRYVPHLRDLGSRLVQRMTAGGRPYVGLHLRLERDVWVRTGCSPGLGADLDAEVQRLRSNKPDMLTSRMNLTSDERFAKGLCPLTAPIVTKILRAFGANSNTRIFWAGGEPMGGAERALAPLRAAFGDVQTKESLALEGELDGVKDKANLMAALDFMLSAAGNVFMASHGGNMAHVVLGHRAYFGFRKTIMPEKRRVVQILLNRTLLQDPQQSVDDLIVAAHTNIGQPQIRKANRDSIYYPLPECMCLKKKRGSSL